MEKMSNIPEFLVTNRKFEELCVLLGLSKEYFMSFPKDSYFLEIGSGLTQNFARGVKEIRPDILTFSIDPTLAINSQDEDSFISKVRRNFWGEPESILYSNKNMLSGYPEYGKSKVEDSQKVRDFRVKEANKTGNIVASLTPEIAFRENSFNLLIDVFGPGLYLQLNSPEEMGHYLREIYRVLKPGGEARIFPAVDFKFEKEANYAYSDEPLKKSENFFNQLIQDNNLNMTTEFQVLSDPKTGDKVNLVIMRKN